MTNPANRTDAHVEAAIVAGYEAGTVVESLAGSHGVDVATVYRILGRAGVPGRGAGGEGHGRGNTVAPCGAWYGGGCPFVRWRGVPVREMAAELDHDRRTVQDHLDSLGVRAGEPNPRRGEAAVLYGRLGSRAAVAQRMGWRPAQSAGGYWPRA